MPPRALDGCDSPRRGVIRAPFCRFAAVAGLLLGVPGCAHDRILEAQAVCGDGRLSPTEECDTSGPGCVQCRTASGYVCTDNVCAAVCGDGQVVGSEECDPPDGLTCNTSCTLVHRAAGCNLSGFYAVKQVSSARDTIVGQLQTASNWYLYQFEQVGSTFEVVASLTCGYYVTGTVTVSLGDPQLRALLYSNPQVAGSPHAPHRGTFQKSASGCDLTFDRFYLVRGLSDDYLPADFSKHQPFTELLPMPSESTPAMPTRDHWQGAVDMDHDGLPGISLTVSGILTGQRGEAQRDWFEYVTDPAKPIAENAVEFDVTSRFDSEEAVLQVSGCSGATCGLLAAGSVPARDIPGVVTFRYLGPDLRDAYAASIVAGSPGDDIELDLKTCAAVRAALPHEVKKP